MEKKLEEVLSSIRAAVMRVTCYGDSIKEAVTLEDLQTWSQSLEAAHDDLEWIHANCVDEDTHEEMVRAARAEVHKDYAEGLGVIMKSLNNVIGEASTALRE